jgi:hypothetical protein
MDPESKLLLANSPLHSGCTVHTAGVAYTHARAQTETETARKRDLETATHSHVCTAHRSEVQRDRTVGNEPLSWLSFRTREMSSGWDNRPAGMLPLKVLLLRYK